MTEITSSALDGSLEFNTIGTASSVEEFNDISDGAKETKATLAARLKTTLKFAAMAGIGVAGLSALIR